MSNINFQVIGMFENGQLEVQEVGTDRHSHFNINELIADKKALDAMQKAQATSKQEYDEYVFELSKRRTLQGI